MLLMSMASVGGCVKGVSIERHTGLVTQTEKFLGLEILASETGRGSVGIHGDGVVRLLRNKLLHGWVVGA